MLKDIVFFFALEVSGVILLINVKIPAVNRCWYFNILKGTATLKASGSEMQALIKPCNLPQTRS